MAPLLPFFLVTTLLGLALSSIVVASFSALDGMVAVTSGVCAVINAALFAAIGPGLADHGMIGAAAQAGFLAGVSGVLTLVTGLALVLLGTWRLGGIARMFPYPVMAGFFAGLSWLVMMGGLRIGAGLVIGIDLPARLADPPTLERLACCVALAFLLVVVPRWIRHWSAVPVLLLAGLLVVHGTRLALGIDVLAAEQAHWLLGPFPAGFMPVVGRRTFAVLAAPDILIPVTQAALSSVFLAASSLVLFVAGLERDLGQTLDMDRELRVAGGANLFGGLAGGLQSLQSMTTTMLLHDSGAGTRRAALVPVAWVAVLLLAGAPVLDTLPTIVPGALLLSTGFRGTVLGLGRECRTLPWHEGAIAVVVAIAIAWLGIIDGVVVGLAMAVGLFAWSYRRIPVIRTELPGSAYHSRMVRPPASLRVLQTDGDAVLAYRLQGYLFFLNANAIVAAVGSRLARAPRLALLVLEFRDVVGIDSSALYTFERLRRMAEDHAFEIVLTDLPPAPRAQVMRSGLLRTGAGRVSLMPTADLALEAAEDRLLAASGLSRRMHRADLAAVLSAHHRSPIDPARLVPYAETVALAAGEVLIRQGDTADALYFLQSGHIVAELQRADGSAVRLMAAEAGALVGELALYADAVRSATVVAATSSSLIRLSRTALARMASADPELAFVVQGFVLRQVAERLIDTSRLLDNSLR